MTETAAPAAVETAPTAAPTVPKIVREVANGVTKPADGTVTGRVWAISSELSGALGKPVPRKDVMEKGGAEGINPATIATQYGKWRVFHGLKGVITTEPKPLKEKKVKAPKAAPAAAATEGAAVEGAAE